jgi:hypothetical protein
MNDKNSRVGVRKIKENKMMLPIAIKSKPTPPVL